MASSYEYSVGSVRAREKTLLTNQDIEQLLSSRDISQLKALLSEKGYKCDGGDIDDALNDQTESVWDYLKSIAPDFSIFAPFLYRNDAHNIKLILKGILSGREYEHLILSPFTVDPADIKSAVSDRSFARLPEWAADSLSKAYDIIAHTGDAQLGDAVIDAAVMNEMTRAVKGVRSQVLTDLFGANIFYNNIKTALRAARAGKDKNFLLLALTDTDGIDKQRLIKLTLAGEQELVAALASRRDYSVCDAMEEYKKSPSAFEKWIDNYLLSRARECKRIAIGAEPMIGFLLAKEAEIRAIHIIASGIRTGMGEQQTRERLRELYG